MGAGNDPNTLEMKSGDSCKSKKKVFEMEEMNELPSEKNNSRSQSQGVPGTAVDSSGATGVRVCFFFFFWFLLVSGPLSYPSKREEEREREREKRKAGRKAWRLGKCFDTYNL